MPACKAGARSAFDGRARCRFASFPGLTSTGSLAHSTDAVIVRPSRGSIRSLVTAPTTLNFPTAFSTVPFGSSTAFSFGTYTGDSFIVDGTQLVLDGGYTSGARLSGTASFANTDFATLGITPGSHVRTLPSADTITLSFGAPPVPVPPAIAALGSALLGLGLWGRRRRG